MPAEIPPESAPFRRPWLAAAAAALAGMLLAGCTSRAAAEVAAGGAAEGGAPHPSPRPNLLLILPDEWQGRLLGCAGAPDAITPNIDALAAQGVLYRNAYSNVPQCSPARSLLLTSRFPSATGVLGNDLPIRTDVESLAHVLAGAGYRCGYIGKWHLNGWREQRYTPPGPERLGFDDFWAANSIWHSPFEGYYFRDTDAAIPIAGYEPATQTDLAVEFIEDHLAAHGGGGRSAGGEPRPFFLMVSYGPPHPPYESPARFEDLYDPAALSLPPNAADGDRGERARYLAALTAIDHEVGRLDEALQRLGASERTLTVFTSDHGAMLGAHGLQGKQVPFEEAAGIPLVMRLPGALPPGARRATLISLADLMPTLLGLLGVEAPEGLAGRDLSWDARGEDGAAGPGRAAPASVFLAELLGLGGIVDHDISTWRAVRTGRHLYAEDRTGPWLLYDLQSDPWQLSNLVGDRSLAGLRDALREDLRAWERRLALPHLPARDLAEQVGALPEVLELVDHVVGRYGHDSTPGRQALKIFDTERTRRNRSF